MVVKRMLGHVFRLLALAGLACLLVAFFMGRQALAGMWDAGRMWPFLASGGAFLLLYWLLLKRRMSFWNTFIHELTHMIVAILTLNRIRALSAAEAGGVTGFEKPSNWLVRLAPYAIPVLPLVFWGATYLFRQDYQMALQYFLWISYLWFVFTVFQHFSFEQPDIVESGRLFSLAFVVMANCVWAVLVYAYLNGEADGLLRIVDHNPFRSTPWDTLKSFLP